MGSSPISKSGHATVNADGLNKDFAGLVLNPTCFRFASGGRGKIEVAVFNILF